ncbi:MAG: hypothetical protein AB8B83_04155 [Bdellovibrionales bacterium]
MSVKEKVDDFSKDFDTPSKQHFQAVYSSHNLIQVVEGVREQVALAVEKCGEANPDIKDAIDARYDSWDGALKPIIKDAEANVENMILAQDYAKKRDLKNVLKFVDDARESKDGDIEKFPVTTPKACDYLRVKMDETEETLSRLLESTLVSLPSALINEIEDAQGEEPVDAQ